MIKGFTSEPDNNIKGLVIADAAEDSLGNIWMSDLDEGIILYNRATGEFSRPFEKELGTSYQASRLYLRNGFGYANNGLFLFKWDLKKKTLTRFVPPAEMNKTLYDMTPDEKGNWWIGSRNGLIVFNEQEKQFKRYTTADGLVNNDINATLYRREDGTILMGMADYFTSFNPQQVTSASGGMPPVVLSRILVNEKPVDFDSAHILNLDYHSTNIVFNWALPDHINSLKNQYYCQLQGIDTGWKYVGNKGEIQYANLSAGQYHLLLKASSSNGTPATNIIRVAFTIHPPFWKTSWFLALAFLGLLMLLTVVVRYISRRNLKEKLLKLEKEQAVEKERNRISRDMHDDLGSGLTKIAIMSEVVKKQIQDPEKAKQQLENISASSRELVDNLQDIIWILNPKNDSLESLAAYIREYGLKFFEPFDIKARFSYPASFESLQLSEETRRNIFLVVKETFNNIVKHAWCNNVNVSITQTGSRFQLTIADDGKGFDINHTRLFGNGLLNMKNRVEQVGGTYTITSEPGKGTSILITMTA
jgi:signal transduction histidine kinase